MWMAILLIIILLEISMYDNQFIKNYNKLINHITDIQTKEKITFKGIKLTFRILLKI